MSLGRALLLVLLAASTQLAPAEQEPRQRGVPQRQLLQPDARIATCTAKRCTGLLYEARGMRSPPNATRRSYVSSRNKMRIITNLGAGANTEQIAKAACGKANVLDPECIDMLLLALTPDAYSSNNTADTFGARAFISPAQDQGTCAVCVGFAVTAAAEAAVNVYKQQNWDKLGLSEQDLSFCKLSPRINCVTGSSYDAVVASISESKVSSWAARSCYPYRGDAAESCFPVNGGTCRTQLPAGASLSVAYDGNALDTMAKVKEQIVLNGGVMTSMAMSDVTFKDFVANKTAINGAFGVAEDLRLTAPGSVAMHAVFCYGWWDNPAKGDDGYWICKNSWSTAWGLQGSFRVAYAAANIMQPDYTFALQYKRASMRARASVISRKLRPNLSRNIPFADTQGWKPECLAYTSEQPTRLLKLADDTTTLALTAPGTTGRLRKLDIIVDLVASNLGYVKRLSVASTGPFRLCGKTAQLLSSLLLDGPPPAASPAPRPSPSPLVPPRSPSLSASPLPSPSPSGAKPPSPSPTPPPNPGGAETCTLERAKDPVCSRCVRSIAIGVDHVCIVLYDASVACAGDGSMGQLGDGKSSSGNHPQLIVASALSGIPVSSAGVGQSVTCVLAASESNKVYCFGNALYGALGSGVFSDNVSKKPVTIQGLKSTTPISQLFGVTTAGGYLGDLKEGFLCALYAGTGDFDTVQCWGSIYGSTPVDIGGTSGTLSLAGSSEYLCACRSDGTVACWTAPDVAAMQVPDISNAISVAAGGGAYSNGGGFGCAVVRSDGVSGSLWCWGKRVGVSDSATPWRVQALAGNVLDVAAGYLADRNSNKEHGHVCVVVETAAGSGDVYCWGDNQLGQLGQGNINSTSPGLDDPVLPPMRVKGISKVTKLFAAAGSTCALTVSQHVACWGDNRGGKLGVGSTVYAVASPVRVQGLCV